MNILARQIDLVIERVKEMRRTFEVSSSFFDVVCVPNKHIRSASIKLDHSQIQHILIYLQHCISVYGTSHLK